MSSCPNCLANNSIKKVYRDGSVFKICEYCNTIVEDTTEREPTVREENEVQNDVEKEKSSGMVTLAIMVGIMILILIIEFIIKLNKI